MHRAVHPCDEIYGDDVPGLSHVRSAGGIDEYRLDANGLRVLYMGSCSGPAVALMLTYGVGSRHEVPGLRGASHMLEHMMFKGSARFDRRQGTSIHQLLLPLGAQVNATTWLDRTNYFELAPVGCLDVAAEIEADRMRHLTFDASDLAAEKAVVMNEYDYCISEPFERLQQAVWGTAFSQHAYGVPVIGMREDIGGFTCDALREYYDAHYWPDNATVTIIGAVDRRATLDLVRHHFEGVPAGRASGADVAHEPEQRSERRVAVASAGAPTAVMLAYRMPAASDPDVDALELLGHVLAGGRLSRLYRPLVGADLASGVWPGISRLRHPGLFHLQAALGEGHDPLLVERIIRDAIADIRTHGLMDEELDRAKGRVRGNLLTSRDGPMAIAMQLSEAIATSDWMDYVDAIKRMEAVRLADVQRVARRYLVETGLTVGYLMNSTAGMTPGPC